MTSLMKTLSLAAMAAVLCAAATAQETAPEPAQAPAGAPQEPAGGEPGSTEPPMVPDTRPLGGIQELSLGSSGEARSFLLPTFRVSQYVDSQPSLLGGGSVEAVTNLAGSVELQRIWSRADLRLNYTGGGTLYAQRSDLNSDFHQGGIALSWRMRRATFTLTDDATYTPESSFGYGGISGVGGLPTGGSSGPLLPGQSILTGRNRRISNTAAGQLQYTISGRSSIHFSGSYGILRFLGSGLNDSDQYGFGFGFDRQLSAFDTLGVVYHAELYRYSGNSRNMDTHSVNLAYGRRITGKLALQLSGGPQIRMVEDPLFGSDTAASWSVRAGLTYQVARTGLSLSYSRDTTAGAGVFAGASTHTVEGSLKRQLSRVWAGSLSGGFSRNETLAGFSLIERAVNTKYAAFSLSRPLGHQFSIFFSYNVQHQTTNVPLCLGCGTSYLRHVGGIGLQWRLRPIPINWF